MSVNYPTAIKDARLQVVLDALDAGSGPGELVVGTSSLSGSTGVLIRLDLEDPAASIASGVLTFLGTPTMTLSLDSGMAALAELRDSNGVIVVSGLTVGLAGSGANITINDVNIVAGQPSVLMSGVIRHG